MIIGGGRPAWRPATTWPELGSRSWSRADRRIGDVWRRRWDSLRLFTPARHDGLPGWVTARGWSFPSRTTWPAALEAYAARFGLQLRNAWTGSPHSSGDGGYLVTAAAASRPTTWSSRPAPAGPGGVRLQLDPGIVQPLQRLPRVIASSAAGGVLVVGPRSGAEIAWVAGVQVL